MTRISRLTVKEMPEKQLVTIRRTIDFFCRVFGNDGRGIAEDRQGSDC